MLVIGPGNDAIIPAMLRLSRERGPWLLEQFQVHERWIDARYRMRGAWAIVRLNAREHPAPPAALRSRVTEHFRVVVLRCSVGAHDELLIDALADAVAAHEQRFKWLRRDEEPASQQIAPRDIDVERIAFEAGIKPAVRLWLDRVDAPTYVHMWQRAGAKLAQVEVDLPWVGNSVFLMVAHTLTDAEALAEAELKQFKHALRLDALRECGTRLGYPSCCVEGFVRSLEFEQRKQDARINAQRSNFHRLDAAWVARPHPHLNTLRVREHIGLISFDPCRLDCAAALAIADRVAPLAEAACPGYGAHLLGSFAIDEHDNRVELELDDERRVRSTRATHPEAEALAAKLLGHAVDERGQVPTLAELCRVFEFVG